ncbi:hypothetical protein QBZ16_001066 [Prototheca wickerhamii]|uniref:Rhodanese domain-containing protein n=1 Tax=Prototheca wickerhamii TaxID=3111 RepID=A0AAD9IFF4_PROWI|nr:hypothetical protein QBZ16_001066 [Prototheca wickerhamii]
MATRINVQEARSLTESGKYTYLDVRTEKEYAAGHAPKAVNIPFAHAGMLGMSPNPDFVEQVKTAFPDTSAPLVIACKAGGRSAKASTALAAAGYSDLKDMGPGFDGWTSEGMPVEQ